MGKSETECVNCWGELVCGSVSRAPDVAGAARAGSYFPTSTYNVLHAGFLLSTETTTSLSLAAIALHLEVGQHEREGLVLIGARWREKAMEMVGHSLWT